MLNYLKDHWTQCGAMWSNFGVKQSETNNVVERWANISMWLNARTNSREKFS